MKDNYNGKYGITVLVGLMVNTQYFGIKVWTVYYPLLVSRLGTWLHKHAEMHPDN